MTQEELAQILFDFWKQTKISEGYHLPSRCPVYERSSDNNDIAENADIVHCGHCSSLLVDFDSLDDYVKAEYLDKAAEYLTKFSG